jgi:hypothetical protein
LFQLHHYLWALFPNILLNSLPFLLVPHHQLLPDHL